MREDTHSDTRNEDPKLRMERINKNRQIRKEKLYGKACVVQECENNSQTRDDKMHVQKLKNRQAAQKSRQQKKQYVTELEEKIKYLEFKLANLRHCQNCQKQLQMSPSENENTNENTHEENNSRRSSEMEYEDEKEFIRISSTEQNSSIGIYLFLFMIVLGVFCMGSRADSSEGFDPLRRDLTQLHSLPKKSQKANLPTPYEYETNFKTTYSTHEQVKTDPASYQNGLLSMDQVRSPSLLTDEKYFQKIITSFENFKLDQYDDKNLRSKAGVMDANKSLMFCNRPQIYKSNSQKEGLLTAFIDIFVRGAQIINIFPDVGSQNANSGNLQLNGLYKITASVQEIQQIGNHNFVY